MSYTYLQEQGAESSAATFSDIPASVLSKLSLTAAASCSSGNGTDACRGSQSGTTFAHSTGDRGVDSLTLCAAGSHARTFPQQDAAAASPASGRDSGRKWPASLAKWDQDTCSWRTHQFSLQGDLELFSETWPRWGLMRGGECWERTMLVPRTSASGSGFWPTPRKSESTESNATIEARKASTTGSCNDNLTAAAERHLGVRVKIQPNFSEWLMGWPIGWTDLQPLGTDKFQAWLHSHGGHSTNEQAKSGGGQ